MPTPVLTPCHLNDHTRVRVSIAAHIGFGRYQQLRKGNGWWLRLRLVCSSAGSNPAGGTMPTFSRISVYSTARNSPVRASKAGFWCVAHPPSGGRFITANLTVKLVVDRGIAMAKDLRVDLAAVQAAADGIDSEADALRAAHAVVHDRIAAAQSGWIATSRSALASATTKWEEESAVRYTHLITHASDCRSAVACYSETDNSNAMEIEGTAVTLRL